MFQVEDTNEVVEAKTNFYQLYEEAKQKAIEAVDETEEAADNTPVSAIEKDDDIEVVRTRRGDEDAKAEEVEAEKGEATTEEAVKAEDAVDGDKARSNDQEEMMVEPDMKAAIKRVGNYFYFNQMNPGAVAQKKSAVNAPKLVYHPYYGYIPVAAEKKDSDMKAVDPEKEPAKQFYIYNPYQGYIPVPQAKEGEKVSEKAEQKFEFHPYFGYIPVSDQKKVEMKASEEKREKYVYHPYFGFMPISQLKGAEKEMKENQKFYFDPYYGFIPVAAKTEEEKMEAAEEMEKVEEEMEQMEEMIEKKVEEMDAVEKVEEEIKEEMKEEMTEEKEAERFYFHPYYGFIPVSKLTDEKMRKQVNMEMKYVLHPYFGFIPESRLKAPEAKIQQKVAPYNPFGYKFLPYQPITAAAPKNYYYTYNTIGDKMKAMTAKVEAKVEAKAVEEAVEMKREKRSATNPVIYQVPASTYPLYSSPVVASPVLAKSNAEPDTKSLLEEQMYQPQYVYSGLPQQQVGAPVTQIKANFAYQPYYYVPFQYAAAKVEAKQDEIVPNFPITPLGATVAQNALPEKDFPIFPYDPEQDKPAAVAF